MSTAPNPVLSDKKKINSTLNVIYSIVYRMSRDVDPVKSVLSSRPRKTDSNKLMSLLVATG